MPLPQNLTAAEQTQIQNEGQSLRTALNNTALRSIDGLADLQSAASVLGNPASTREELGEAGGYLKGYVQGVRAIARQNQPGGGGSGLVGCLYNCETQYSRCLQTSSAFLCDIEAASCLISCGVGGSGFAITGSQPVAPT